MRTLTISDHGFYLPPDTSAAPISTIWHTFGWASSFLADDLTGGLVAAWPDGKGGTSMAQATGIKRPYKGRHYGPNNQPGVRFDGIDDVLTNGGGAVASPLTYVLIAKQLSVVSGAVLMSGNGATTRPFISVTPTDWRLSTTSTALFGGTPNTSWHGIVALFSGASSQMWLDGTSLGTGSIASSSPSGISLGGNSSGTGSFTPLVVAAVGVYAGNARTNGSWSSLVADAATKWGVAL